MNNLRSLPLAAIQANPAVQQRVQGTSEEVVRQYAEEMSAGDDFPPVVVFSNDEVTYHLADGFHRLQAHRLAHPDKQEIDCEFYPGGSDDALLFACGANASHGLRRTNADKKKAVLQLLKSERRQWSDRDIARQCKVSHTFVGKIRGHLETLPDESKDAGDLELHALARPETSATDPSASALDRSRKVKRGGASYNMKTAAIGSGSPRRSPCENAKSIPPLTSLAWSEASEAERVKFVRDVGAREIVDAFRLIAPGFSILDWAWQRSRQDERQSFANEHRDEFKALANPSGYVTAAEPARAQTDTSPGLGSLEDPSAIPNSQRRGNPDFSVKTRSGE
jgi:ParB-like nuclease domain